MKEQKTTSILQRLPVILAVTAASYGLQVHAQTRHTEKAAVRTTAAQGKLPMARDRAFEPKLASQG